MPPKLGPIEIVYFTSSCKFGSTLQADSKAGFHLDVAGNWLFWCFVHAFQISSSIVSYASKMDCQCKKCVDSCFGGQICASTPDGDPLGPLLSPPICPTSLIFLASPLGVEHTICDDGTKEKNVIRKSPSICTTLARREYWGAVDLLSTKTDQTIQQHCFLFCEFFLVSKFRDLAKFSHVLTYNVLSYELMHLIRLFD